MNLNFHQHKVLDPKAPNTTPDQGGNHRPPNNFRPKVFRILAPSQIIKKKKKHFHHIPSQRKRQPISDPPRNQQHPIREPNPSRAAAIVRSIRPRMARQVDRHQQHDARRQRDGQEHRHEEIPGRRAQGEVVAEDEEDDAGDHQEGDESEDFGWEGRGRGGCGGGEDGQVHSFGLVVCLLTIEVRGFVVPLVMLRNDGRLKLSESGLGGTLSLRRNDDAAAVAEVSAPMACSGVVLQRTKYITYVHI